jgi:hypothetical protein
MSNCVHGVNLSMSCARCDDSKNRAAQPAMMVDLFHRLDADKQVIARFGDSCYHGRPINDPCPLCDADRKTLKTQRIRETVATFSEAMAAKLHKNDHKTGWRDLPIEALFRQLMIEIEEFKVAKEFFSHKEARDELVDIANFALMLHDRLGIEPTKEG